MAILGPRLPDELIALAAEGRLIPFVGAGFSADLDLPDWESMLRAVHERMQDGLTFDQLLASTNRDYLQVAEYLYLRHDRQIGPIRQQIERAFSAEKREPLRSAAHVELVNLGAKQIYTTNYDDLVESTYRSLGIDHTPVILPKDVALADSNTTQIVKYHGDLAHERTLVLTESSYFKRLDFESPMDLKFRSDLLGKSVLFMGYSFRDVNIRIIWFKLMDMMRDIPEADRRPSYIVRLESNPALEELYAAVGLKTIVLPKTDGGRPLGRFLFDLAARASALASASVQGVEKRTYVSTEAIRRANELADRMRGLRLGRVQPAFAAGASELVVDRIFTGFVPDALKAEWDAAAVRLLSFRGVDEASLAAIATLPESGELTEFAVSQLSGVADADVRAAKRKLLAVPEFWAKIWSQPISAERAVAVLRAFVDEIRFQANEGADEDIAFLADLAMRIRNGILRVNSSREEFRTIAGEAIELAAQTYPSIKALSVDDASAPEVARVLDEVEAREADLKRRPSAQTRHQDPERWYSLYEGVMALSQEVDRGTPRPVRASARRSGR